jgi:ribosomal-protein-alanine N-acetyltransferase
MAIEFKIIETARLLLKGLTPKDVFAIFSTLPKAEIMEVMGHRNEEEYQQEEHKHLNGYAAYNRQFLYFLMVDKATGKIIGRCALHNWNPDHRRAELGYRMIEEDFKRKGLMSEAVKALVEYGFGEMGLHRIEALVGAENVPSIRIIEKNGFVREGLLRKHYFINGNYMDSILYAKLKAEHESERTV